MKNFFAALFFILFLSPASANSPILIQERLQWTDEPQRVQIAGETFQRWGFQGAVFADDSPVLPVFVTRFPLEGYGRLSVEVVRTRYEKLPLQKLPESAQDLISEQLRFDTRIEKHHRSHYGKLAVVPIVRRGGGYEKLVEMEVRVEWTAVNRARPRGPGFADNSVLRNGDIYRIAVEESGIHRIGYDFLSGLGLNIDNVNPDNLQLFGNPGGMLPTDVFADRPDDLLENAIQIVGADDGSFDQGDYILFYAEGPDRWRAAGEGDFVFQKNIYDDRNFYFIKVGDEAGLRIEEQSSLDNTAFTSSASDAFVRFEEDRLNLMHEWRPNTQGSGQRWYGDRFRVAREKTYDNLFTLNNIDPTTPVRVRAEMALRALQRSRFTLEVNGASLQSNLARRVSFLSGPGSNEIDYAATGRLDETLQLEQAEVDVTLRYPHPAGAGDGSEGWLDFIQLNYRRQLVMNGDQMRFRDTRTTDFPTASFRLQTGNSNLEIWDITNPQRPRRQITGAGGQESVFGFNSQSLKTFLAFRPNGSFPQPEAVGPVANQNLHAINRLNMVILYHPEFEESARRLAEHRRNHSGLEVAAVPVQRVFNEFSSGRKDPSAIRNFMRMLYERDENFRYLLLFGDGSFDSRDIYELGGDFVPVYETRDFNPLSAFPSDDYYGILENENANNPLDGILNIGVGRLPVKTMEEATILVDKIIRYETEPNTLGDWRNRLVFVGDDEDGMLHTQQSNNIAVNIQERFGSFNLNKIYLDAFPQVSTPGGNRFPAATEAINQSIFQGALVMTYLGHGGSSGLAQERVLSISDILQWENREKLPLFLTATCSFTGFDDPAFVTAGEEAILNPRGGVVGLLTTVRAVFASSNAALTERALQRLFERRSNGDIRPLGEVMRLAKNDLNSSFRTENSRKFLLIGDPAMQLAIPRYRVETTAVDGEAVGGEITDTLRALQQVTVSGRLLNDEGELFREFNGLIFPTVFDKPLELTTLGQDPGSFRFNFEQQRNVIFKGRASVTKGEFEFTFVVPKDINFDFGRGKISYYASQTAQRNDAAGAYEGIVIGGAGEDALADDQGPEVEVFLNSTDFVFGGVTGPSPTLLVQLRDDNGINVVGNSIGHDLEGILDEDTQNTLLLNDFYEAEVDDFTRGSVRFPLEDLEPGRHTLRVKAWDVANNSAEGYTEFVVAEGEEIALERVLNYPNPFTEFTCFQFDHNLANQQLDVLIQIFTVSGRLVKTIERSFFSDGALRRDDCISWDGRDDFGDQLARGVYLYKVKVRAVNTGNTTLEGESAFEKLVILK